VGWNVVAQRDWETMQALLDSSPQAQQYFSDEFSTYQTLIYDPGQHQAVSDKSQTYSVEGGNADLRHYLARLARRSRCFSRCIHALCRAIKLFVYCYNQRQLHKHRYPNYPAHLFDFVTPLS
jgi:insertion element IS1 protein InsB